MIGIWGRASSNSVQKALWCLGELGVAYERFDTGAPFGGPDSEAYRRLNPTGLLPVLRDGDMLVWESNAILRYLAARYGDGGLWPADPARRSLADRWIDWQQGLLQALWPMFEELVRKPAGEGDIDRIERSRQQSAALLAQLDLWLDGRSFVAGEHLTIGDIPVGIWAHRWFSLPVERPPARHLEAWYARLCARAAYQDTIMRAPG